MRALITDFDAIETAIAGLGETVDDAFCALGIPIKAAGSREAFRRVDFGYVVAFARAARAAGARRFMLVSAIGASARSAIFYLRARAAIEEALAALGYPVLHIFRPGLLLGDRAESRPREAMSAAWPKDDVAPRMTSNCPFWISRLRNRQVQAVAYVSGIAASSAHGSSD